MKTLSKFVVLVALLPAPTAGALCVSTDNDLAIALQQAETTPVTIQLVKGSYRLDLTPWGTGGPNAKPGTSLLGGYTAPSCASRDVDPANTVLTDNGNARAYFVFPDGDFTIDGLTVHLSGPFLVYGGSTTSADATVIVRHSVFNSHLLASTDAALYIFWVGNIGTNGTVRVIDSLANSTPGACGFAAKAEQGQVAYYFLNDTAVFNVADSV